MTYKEHIQVLSDCNNQLDKTLESSEEALESTKRLFPLNTAIFQKTSDIEHDCSASPEDGCEGCSVKI